MPRLFPLVLLTLLSSPALADELRVAVVQFRSGRDLADNVARHAKAIARAAKAGARVVVFPECSVTGYFEAEFMRALSAEALAAAEAELATACRDNDVHAIVGMPHRTGGKLYNSAVVLDPAGRVIERYHKLQLAEDWPDAGDHLVVFPIDGVPCTAIVCHDERYPELVRLPVLAGARVVFYLSHESGLRAEHKLGPYRAQIQARAVENTVFVAHANAPAEADAGGSHGQSRLIDPAGRILDEASIFGDETLIATLDLDQATRALALRSVRRGVLGDWWLAGVEHVRIVAPLADR